MPLTKRTEVSHRDVLVDGQIQVRIDTVIEEDGVEISRVYHRYVLAPGDNITNETVEIRRVASADWTPAVIAAYEAAKRARARP